MTTNIQEDISTGFIKVRIHDQYNLECLWLNQATKLSSTELHINCFFQHDIFLSKKLKLTILLHFVIHSATLYISY